MDVTTKTSGGDGGDFGGDDGDGFDVHLSTPIDPAGEISDVGHCAHLPAPSSYVFGRHGCEILAALPLVALGEQLSKPTDPAGESSDVGHCAHLPAPSSYVFGAHAVHDSIPLSKAPKVGGKPGGHLHPQKRA